MSTTASSERGRVRVESSIKRVRAFISGHAAFDTLAPLLVWEIPYYPTYYVRRDDVIATLEPSGQVAHSPSRGDARYFDVVIDGHRVANGAYDYPDSSIEELRDAVCFVWAVMDEWMEEDEVVYVHARDPYTRVDILQSSRRIQVVIEGVDVADSDQPRVLFETGLPARYYLPLTQVRADYLRPTDTVTRCPYKGTANYFSVEIGDKRYDDYVWMYRAPLLESARIGGLVSFYNERVDIYLDSVLQERPRSPFS